MFIFKAEKFFNIKYLNPCITLKNKELIQKNYNIARLHVQVNINIKLYKNQEVMRKKVPKYSLLNTYEK